MPAKRYRYAPEVERLTVLWRCKLCIPYPGVIRFHGTQVVRCSANRWLVPDWFDPLDDDQDCIYGLDEFIDVWVDMIGCLGIENPADEGEWEKKGGCCESD